MAQATSQNSAANRWSHGFQPFRMRPWLLQTTCSTRVLYAEYVIKHFSARNAASHSKPGQDGWPKEVFTSDRITDRKSVFQAHATELKDVTLLPTFLDYLASLQSLKRATHCMYAYRSTDTSHRMENLACGQNDGGESGSGDRLSRLLELSNCENVIVVVSRWYGGTKLGSDRWKRISEVAKDALNRGGFTNQGPSTGKKKHK